MHPVTRCICALLFLGSVSSMGTAAEIKVLAGGATQSGLIAAAPVFVFRKEASHEIKADYTSK